MLKYFLTKDLVKLTRGGIDCDVRQLEKNAE